MSTRGWAAIGAPYATYVSYTWTPCTVHKHNITENPDLPKSEDAGRRTQARFLALSA